MINSLREKDSAELAQMRNDWDETSQRVHSLQAEIDSSLVLVSQTCTERDELRAVLDDRQAMIAESRVEDNETMEEMKALLAEIAGQDSGDASEASQKSGVELTKQVVALIEKNLERLAKRAEVSADFPFMQGLGPKANNATHSQYIHNQNEHIKFLQERLKHFEEDTDDGISREREVSSRI